jgi:hypothetical protein
MALNDILLSGDATFGSNGTITYNVAASATLIHAGEPVAATLGTLTGTPMATNKPVVATDYLAGIAVSTSTNTASVAGTVEVRPLLAGQKYDIVPKVAIATQAAYNVFLGYRVLIDLTAGSYTLLVADGVTYGCIILPNDLLKNPGKVTFTFRNGVSNLS